MNILNFCLFDWGGGGIRLTKAINKYTKHKARHLLIGRDELGYEHDIVTKNPEEILKWINWADVVHCREYIAPLYIENPNTFWYWLYEKLKDLGLKTPPSEKLMITYVGTKFRQRPGEQHEIAMKMNARELVAGFDLMEAWDGTDLNDGPRGPLVWFPDAIPVDDYFKMKTEHEGKPIVCQAPTKRALKSTDRILELIADKDNIEVLIIEKVSFEKCMKLKSKADIYLGSFRGGIGTNDLEAMAMKIPVINNVTAKTRFEFLFKREVGYLPYYDCPLRRLPQGIDALISDKELYNKYAELGYGYVKEFHDEPVIARKFISICEEL